MTKPKLTRAQRLVYDWLAESQDHQMICITGRTPSAFLTDRSKSQVYANTPFRKPRADVLFSLQRFLHKADKSVGSSCYIHPDHVVNGDNSEQEINDEQWNEC